MHLTQTHILDLGAVWTLDHLVPLFSELKTLASLSPVTTTAATDIATAIFALVVYCVLWHWQALCPDL